MSNGVIPMETIDAVIERSYRPAPAVRVGILAVAGALDDGLDTVERVLGAAGHTVPRRFGQLLTRPGEDRLRREDVADFLDLYGHEYALVALRGWDGDDAAGITGTRGAEAELVELAIARGCAVIWRLGADDDRAAIEAAGAEIAAA